MKRRLFTILSALSLMLYLATVGLWVRSHWVADHATLGHYVRQVQGYRETILRITSSNGVVMVAWERLHATGLRPGTGLIESWERNHPNRWVWERKVFQGHVRQLPPPTPSWLSRCGFWIHGSASQTPGRSEWSDCSTAVPFWLLAGTCLVLPALYGSRLWRQHRRYRFGLCPSCGYDLRASRERCPECGTPIPAPPVTASGKV
jgi:hypothetical protein